MVSPLVLTANGDCAEAASNRHHTVEQQVCRLILLPWTRVHGNLLHLTQERLAGKSGVRRESVTEVALALRRAGLIRGARGSIEALDRGGLEARACECYGVVRRESGRLSSPTHARPADIWTEYRSGTRQDLPG